MSPRLEHQFLPAVLEIQDTPPSPIGRAILWTLMAFFLCALAWGILGWVDIVAVATGKIFPTGHVKVIQPLETGTVTEIYVTEGQRVMAGEPLLQLDSRTVDAEIAQLTGELTFLGQQIQRLHWLIGHQDTGQDIPKHWNDPLLRGQWREYRDRIETLHMERSTVQAQHSTAFEQAEKLAAILPIINERSQSEKTLVDKHLFPRQQYLETEQQRLTALYDLKSQNSRVRELERTLAGIDARIRHTQSEFAKTQLEQLAEAERRQHHTQQELVKVRTRKRALRLTAPIDGTVQQLAVYTHGAVVTPAQPLMVIVPLDALLEIEAYVKNRDVGFVRAGQPATIKLDAFPFTEYGTLDGEIVDLSHDAIRDEKLGLVYKARVSLKQAVIQVEGKPVKLVAGMAASIEIKTGQRRLIEFFLAPLLRYRDESIRER